MSAAQSAWDIDLKAWPLILVRPRPEVTDSQLIAALKAYDEILDKRQGPYAMVMDNRHAPALPAAQRKIIAEYNAAHGTRTRLRCRGTAFVMTSPFVRGLMTAVFWLKKPLAETIVFEELDDALRWARARLETNSLSPMVRPSGR